MNEYEIAVVFDPGLEVDLAKATERVSKILEDSAGKVKNVENWGKRPLAYPINRHETGIYVFYKVELPAENVRKVETALNITDEVIRFLIVRLDLKAIAKAEAAKAEKAKKAAERGETVEAADDTDA